MRTEFLFLVSLASLADGFSGLTGSQDESGLLQSPLTGLLEDDSGLLLSKGSLDADGLEFKRASLTLVDNSRLHGQVNSNRSVVNATLPEREDISGLLHSSSSRAAPAEAGVADTGRLPRATPTSSFSDEPSHAGLVEVGNQSVVAFAREQDNHSASALNSLHSEHFGLAHFPSPVALSTFAFRQVQAEYWLPSTYPVDKSKLASINVMFLGLCGLDRCYMGMRLIGCLKFVTVGGFLILFMLDFLVILMNCVMMSKTINFLGYKAHFEIESLYSAYAIHMAQMTVFVVASMLIVVSRMNKKKRPPAEVCEQPRQDCSSDESPTEESWPSPSPSQQILHSGSAILR